MLDEVTQVLTKMGFVVRPLDEKKFQGVSVEMFSHGVTLVIDGEDARAYGSDMRAPLSDTRAVAGLAVRYFREQVEWDITMCEREMEERQAKLNFKKGLLARLKEMAQ